MIGQVGIAYRARLPDPGVLPALVDLVRARAEPRGWLVADAPEDAFARARVQRIEGSVDDGASLSLGGLWVNPHFGADDLCLVFDRRSGRLIDPSRASASADDPRGPLVNDFALVRTTWADAATHVALIGLLEDLAAHDLSSIELGDPTGQAVARDREAVEERIHRARVAFLAGQLERPHEPFEPGGVAHFIPPSEARRRRSSPPGPDTLLEARERDVLRRARGSLGDVWKDQAPGLDGPPEQAVVALERLTDLALSQPVNREAPSRLEERFVWDVGAFFGYLLIDAFGGYWERRAGRDGTTTLRVVNLGGIGLTWAPMRSAVDRLRTGPLYAHDHVFFWLRRVIAAATEALGDA